MPCFGYGEVLILGCFSPYVLISPHVHIQFPILDSKNTIFWIKGPFLNGQMQHEIMKGAAWEDARGKVDPWWQEPRHSALGEVTVQRKSRHSWYLCHLMSIRCVFNEIKWNCLYSRWKKYESVNSSIPLIWTSFFRPTRCQFLWRFRQALMFNFRTRDTLEIICEKFFSLW